MPSFCPRTCFSFPKRLIRKWKCQLKPLKAVRLVSHDLRHSRRNFSVCPLVCLFRLKLIMTSTCRYLLFEVTRRVDFLVNLITQICRQRSQLFSASLRKRQKREAREATETQTAHVSTACRNLLAQSGRLSLRKKSLSKNNSFTLGFCNARLWLAPA